MTALLYMYNIIIMKKIVALLSVISLTLLASCGNQEMDDTMNEETTIVETTTEENMDAGTDTEMNVEVEIMQ